MKVARETSQPMQRVKVGLIGLAAVILLIGIASAIMRTATRESPTGAAGSSQAEVVANMAIDNSATATGEPLADLGVTASPENNAVAPSQAVQP